jgi:hypothetical protein
VATNRHHGVTLAGVALVVALLVVLVAVRAWRQRRPPVPSSDLSTKTLVIHVDPGSATLSVRDASRAWQRDLALSVLVDGVVRSLDFGDAPPTVSAGTLQARVRFDLDGAAREATLAVSVQADADVVVMMLQSPALALAARHTVGLRAEVSTAGRSAFLSGTGEIADLGTNRGQILLVDAEKVTLGFVSLRGPLEVSAVVDDPDEVGTPMRLAVIGPSEAAGQGGAVDADLRIALGSSSRVVGALYRLAGEHALHVRGEVTGASGGARVFGLDANGTPVVRIDTDPAGHFAFSVPATVVEWYATLGASLTSAPIRYKPGSGADLHLSVAPGGTLRVRVTDPDTKRPLTARVIVRGEGSTLDPSFGPDYRATGAGPVIDALRGELETPLPEGHYRVLATKGLEWSIDAKEVVVESGHSVDVELAPRHVIPSDGVVDCDLHVHARPSFDSPVSPEDRVLSLVAAGIDFAVPSEHNTVGDYSPMLATLELSRQLSTVSGVEVTTYSPRFGHFGVFPYPKGPVPPYRATTASQIFAAAHRDPARVLQVNHPRLSKGIGYFDVVRFDPKAPRVPPNMRTDFDTLEVYNGFDGTEPARVDAVLRDWFALLNLGYRFTATGSSDSHRIQYQWAGYPRTMVSIPVTAPVDEALGVDPLAVVAAIKKGRASVTSGPVVDLEVDGARAGDEAVALDGRVRAHVTVRAAPWVDVTSLDIVVAGRVAQTISIPSRPTVTGPEPGSLGDAQLRTFRLDETVTIDVGAADGWILVVARGSRRLDDVLPFMPVAPMAFTNPVWLLHDPANFFGPPRPRAAPPTARHAREAPKEDAGS